MTVAVIPTLLLPLLVERGSKLLMLKDGLWLPATARVEAGEIYSMLLEPTLLDSVLIGLTAVLLVKAGPTVMPAMLFGLGTVPVT